jgi:hypothetical protein
MLPIQLLRQTLALHFGRPATEQIKIRCVPKGMSACLVFLKKNGENISKQMTTKKKKKKKNVGPIESPILS